MPFELFVALRFLREGRAQTALILGGTTVGVGVIIFLTALIGGLQRTLIEQTLSSQAHVTLRRPERLAQVLPAGPGEGLAAVVEKVPDRSRSVESWPDVVALVRAAPEVLAATPIAAGAAFATRATVNRSVMLRGIDPESFGAVIRMDKAMRAGQLRVGGGEVVIGAVLAEDLGLAVGDKLRLETPEGRADVFSVTGIFDLGNRDVNQRWVLCSLRAAQTLLDLQGGVTALEVKVDDVFGAEAVAADLSARTGLLADSWMKVNRQLLIGLRSQNASSWMIKVFVILAVALGIASVLGVSVIQKSRQIGILKATGTSTGAVLRIFLAEGAIVGLLGSAGGAALGTAMSLFFASLARSPNGDPVFPVDLSPGLFLLASAVAMFTGLASAAYPARRAARLDPATVIRHG